jgi:hypothetical protein
MKVTKRNCVYTCLQCNLSRWALITYHAIKTGRFILRMHQEIRVLASCDFLDDTSMISLSVAKIESSFNMPAAAFTHMFFSLRK